MSGNVLPPLEMTFIGGIIADPSVFYSVNVLPDELSPAGAAIFGAIERLLRSKKTVGINTIVADLASNNLLDVAGGADTVANVAMYAVSADGVDTAAVGIKKQARLRKYKSYLSQVDGMIENSDDPDVIAGSIVEFFLNESVVSGAIHVEEAVERRIDIIERMMRGEQVYLTTGVSFIDERLGGGLMPGRMYVYFGMPEHGKSLAATVAMVKNALAGYPSLVFSREARPDQVVIDMLGAMAPDVNRRHLKTGLITDEEFPGFMQAAGELSKLPIYIDSDTATIEGMQLEVARFVTRVRSGDEDGKESPALVVVDYLQRIISSDSRYAKRDRRIEIEYISRSLKDMAMNYKVPIIVISSVNKGAVGRGDKRPQIVDLRESNQIAHDADVVFGFYRDELVHPGEDTYNLGSNKGIVEWIAEKDRQTGDGHWKFVTFFDPKNGYVNTNAGTGGLDASI